GSAVDGVLGFLQAQAGQFANDLDDADLVGAGFDQNDVEFGLLFSSSGSAASSRSGHGNSGGSSRHAELLFHFLDQFRQFENGHASDGVKDFSFAKCHLIRTPGIYSMPDLVVASSCEVAAQAASF